VRTVSSTLMKKVGESLHQPVLRPTDVTGGQLIKAGPVSLQRLLPVFGFG